MLVQQVMLRGYQVTGFNLIAAGNSLVHLCFEILLLEFLCVAELFVSLPTFTPEEHPLLAACNCLLNIFTAIWRLYPLSTT